MRQLKVSNNIIGDRAALQEAMDRDGYWFFHDVLDKDAVRQLRESYMDVLRELGLIDKDADVPKWNGAPLDDFVERMKLLTARAPWRDFRAQPAINEFFVNLLGHEPLWLPLIVYRVSPPRADDGTSRFKLVHQDGYFNKGVNFTICWMPLDDIDEEVGGMTIAEGVHKRGYLHNSDAPPMFLIPDDAIPEDAWVRADYKLGDLLIIDERTPHTGLRNHSDRFRMSMDFRLMPNDGPIPFIGTVKEISRDLITIETESGETVNMKVNDQTFCRGKPGNALYHEWCPRDELTTYVHPGEHVIVTSREGEWADLIRHAHILHRA
jgi:ectoine hydroxylase-related dioxygenase (phytanoyl-CoA dioxygenase family)